MRYSVEKLTSEELQKIEQSLNETNSRRKALVEKFNKQKADHLVREQMEEKYQKDLEKRMEAERLQKEEETRKLIEEQAQKDKE